MEYDQQHAPTPSEYHLDSLEPSSSLMSAFAPPQADASGGPQRRRRSTQGVYHHPYVNTGTNIGGGGMPKEARKASTSSLSDDNTTTEKSKGNVRQTDNTPFKSYLEAVHDDQDRLCWLRCTFCKSFPERGGANAHSTTPDRIRKHLPACKGPVPEDLRTAAAHGTRTSSAAELALKDTTNQPFATPSSPAPKRGDDVSKRRRGRYSSTAANAASNAAAAAAAAAAANAAASTTPAAPHAQSAPSNQTPTATTPTIENISQSLNTSNQANSTNLAHGIALDQLHVLKSRVDMIDKCTPKEMANIKRDIVHIQRDIKSLNGKVEQLLGYMLMNSHIHQTQSNTPRQSPLISQFPMHSTQQVSPTNVQDRVQVVRLTNDEDSPEPNENHQPRQMPLSHQQNTQPQFRDNWFAESNNLVDVQ